MRIETAVPLRGTLTKFLAIVVVAGLTATMSEAKVSLPRLTMTIGIGLFQGLTAPGDIRTFAVTDPRLLSATQYPRRNALCLHGLAEGETTLVLELVNGHRVTYLIQIREFAATPPRASPPGARLSSRRNLGRWKASRSAQWIAGSTSRAVHRPAKTRSA